jgi:hypothetical protein
LRRADLPSKESYRLYKKDYETEEEATVQQRTVEPIMNECCLISMERPVCPSVSFIRGSTGWISIIFVRGGVATKTKYH